MELQCNLNVLCLSMIACYVIPQLYGDVGVQTAQAPKLDLFDIQTQEGRL